MKLRYVFTILLILLFKTATAPVKDQGVIHDELLSWQENIRVTQLKARIDTADFSPELFLQALYLYVDHPEIVYRQAVVETGWFTSPVFKNLNNISGMHYADKRETTAIGWRWADYYNGRYHKMSKYAHWSHSVYDISVWQEYWKAQGHDLGDYYGFLRDLPYAAAKDYLTLVQSINLP